eukprot:1157626-Pelagomonas_calceolata.AAC.3
MDCCPSALQILIKAAAAAAAAKATPARARPCNAQAINPPRLFMLGPGYSQARPHLSILSHACFCWALPAHAQATPVHACAAVVSSFQDCPSHHSNENAATLKPSFPLVNWDPLKSTGQVVPIGYRSQGFLNVCEAENKAMDVFSTQHDFFNL